MSHFGHHAEWLSLIEVSGPFLAEPVLKEAFPQGLAGLDGAKKKTIRQAYDEWREAIDLDEPDARKVHRAWVELVLGQGLELDEDGSGDVLKLGGDVATIKYDLPEYGVMLAPDFVVTDGQGAELPLMLVSVYDAEIVLGEAFKQGTWSASPAERMVTLCRATGVRLGLVTNGEQWMLVDAPVGAVTTFASWYARLWSQEPITLQAFINLLGIRRFFVDRAEQLPALLDNSVKFQDEVTDALGEQVRRAVEVLIQALDRAHVDSGRTLLEGVEPTELYEAGLTVMMRIVFLLSAEERGLLLMGDELYETNYAVSTLRLQLRAESEEILERRWDAWSRLLSLFRAVYGGIDHEALRLPALGGSLFDPDRFPFLEGRPRGSRWKMDLARPLPIDNRTVMLLLEAVQLFRGRTLSYMALDVEQIGYVYEGLLERTVVRAAEVTLDLDATKDAKNPWVTLPEIEDAAANGRVALEELFKERMESSASRIRNDLNKPVDDASGEKLLVACHADWTLRDRIAPYFHLLRTDPWGFPLVYPKGTFMVASGSDRRETGTHYTPKSLTEMIVKETLEPLAYVGPVEGESREDWQLKSPGELLELRVCDPAMGSGAFLVQVCRWLSERLAEAWMKAEDDGKAITVEGAVVDEIAAFEPLRKDAEERLITARRLIAERCLYGVDLNPLAVELAKLSIWLVTLAKGRPFGFLDHNLRCGDSLLGITSLDQLYYLEINPDRGSSKKLFAHEIDEIVSEATTLRVELRSHRINDIRDVEFMASLDGQARTKLHLPFVLSDALVGEYLAAQGKAIDTASLSIEAGEALRSDPSKIRSLETRSSKNLNSDLPPGKPRRHPFHWPLEFPEVFARPQPGFDAMVGNPPFIGNKFWKERLGAGFQNQAKLILRATPGKIDLCVVFHRRVAELLRERGCYGLLATDNIAEGGAITVGLGSIVSTGDIFFSKKGVPWPGKAAVSISIICFFKGEYRSPKTANGISCQLIGARLVPVEADNWEPRALSNGIFSLAGIDNSKGLAFVITSDNEWFEGLRNEPKSLLVPYVSGEDITNNALASVERWALDIADRELIEIETEFPRAFRFLSDVVQPTRTSSELKSYKGLEDRWWQFWNHRADLMRRLRQRSHFVAYSKNTTFPFCMMAPSSWIYTNKVVLIGVERGDELALCLSSFFRAWLETYSGGRLRGWLTISINDSIATFPAPVEIVSGRGIAAAERFNDTAVAWARNNDVGITGVVNAIHSPDNNEEPINILRDLLHQIDAEVALAYGWDDCDLLYGFRISHDPTTKLKEKYEVSESARADVVARLVGLNRSRSEGMTNHVRTRGGR